MYHVFGGHSYFTHCATAKPRELGVPFLGAIPLNTRIREFGDAGTPEKTFTSAGDLVLEAVEKVASALAGQISIRSLEQTAQPTLSIESSRSLNESAL